MFKALLTIGFPLTILNPEDPIDIHNIIVGIYGDPGIGKTSLAQTSSNPITLDTDNGIHRSAFRKHAVQVKKWGDIGSLSAADLTLYKTIVIDSVGRCLDLLTEDIPQKEGKSAANKRFDGTLTQPGYGTLKSRFQQWVNKIRGFGKDIVFISHAKEKGMEDQRIIRPDIIGGSYDFVVRMCDFIGYYYSSQEPNANHGVLDFSPSTGVFIGKNSAKFPKLFIPDLSNEPDYLAIKIQEMKDSIKSISATQSESIKMLNRVRDMVSKSSNAIEFSNVFTFAKENCKTSTLQNQAWAIINNALPENIVWDSKEKVFKDK